MGRLFLVKSLTKNKTVVAKEKKCGYRMSNPSGKTICKVKIDNCLIREGLRCDYLMIDCKDNNAFFVELKGSDLLHAIDQISRSIDCLKEDIVSCNVFARIVLTKANVPNLRNNPKILRFEKRLRKRGGNLRKETIKMEEKV